MLTVDKKDFEAAVDRVSTVSSERGRAVKLSLTGGRLMLSVTNPDSGSATEELEVDYDADPLDIGFNSRYLLDIAAQIEGEVARAQARRPRLADADPGQGRQGRALRADADAGVMPVMAGLSGHPRLADEARAWMPAWPADESMTAAFLRRLSLTNFRSYHAAQLELAAAGPVVLTGANGAGKTNLIEAISLLAPGRGLRRATFEELAFSEGDGAWAVSAEIEGMLGLATLGTGIDPPAGEDASPIAAMPHRPRNGSSAAAFADHLRVVWLTPAMDRLFNGPASERRRFLDRLVLAVDASHSSRVVGARALAALAQPAAGRRRRATRIGSTRSSTRPPSSRWRWRRRAPKR